MVGQVVGDKALDEISAVIVAGPFKASAFDPNRTLWGDLIWRKVSPELFGYRLAVTLVEDIADVPPDTVLIPVPNHYIIAGEQCLCAVDR